MLRSLKSTFAVETTTIQEALPATIIQHPQLLQVPPALDTLEGIRSTNPAGPCPPCPPCPFTLAGLMGKTVATLTAPHAHAPCVLPATMGTVGMLGTSTGAVTGGLRDMGDVSKLPWDGDFRSV